MRGASALQTVLEAVPSLPVEVDAIWEPILPSDLVPPTEHDVSLLTDGRARQLWDPDHLVSTALLAGMGAGSQTGRGPLIRKGLVWDTVALFQPGGRWEGQLPKPDYVGSDVVDSAADVQRLLQAARGR